MSKEACELPLIQYKDKNGKTRTKPSRVFGQLMDKFSQQPDIAIYLYAYSRTKAFQTKMESLGYTMKNGEFSVDEILSIIDLKSLIDERSPEILDQKAVKLGIKHKNGENINFQSESIATAKAQEINQGDMKDAITAFPIKEDDQWHVIIMANSSYTAAIRKKVLNTNIAYKNIASYLKNLGVNIDDLVKKADLYECVSTITDIPKLFLLLDSNQDTKLSKSQLAFLFATQLEKPTFQVLLENTPEKYFTNVIGEPVPAVQAFVDYYINCINKKDKMPDMDMLNTDDVFTDAKNQLLSDKQTLLDIKNTIKTAIEDDPDYQLAEELDKLKEQEIAIDEDLTLNAASFYDRITQVNMAAMLKVREKRKQLMRKVKLTQQESETLALLNMAYDELNQEQNFTSNYTNLLLTLSIYESTFKQEKDSLQQRYSEVLHDSTMNPYEKAITLGELTQQVEDLINSYSAIVKSAMNIEKIQVFDNRSKEIESKIKDQATKVLADLEQFSPFIAQAKHCILTGLFQTFRGDVDVEGRTMTQIINEASKDQSVWGSFWNGITEQKNLYASLAGEILARKQLERDQQIIDITHKIRNAEEKLRKAKCTSNFMYDEKGNIRTPYNISAWQERLEDFQTILKEQNLSREEYAQQMKTWHEENSIKIVLKNSDTGLQNITYIPNDKYEDLSWTKNLKPAELEYYETMMGPLDKDYNDVDYNDPNSVGLKPYLDNISPDRGLRIYTPPQVAKTVLDCFTETGMSVWERITLAGKILVEKYFKGVPEMMSAQMQNDIGYAQKRKLGVEGVDYIPFNYTKKINSKFLRKDFGSALVKYAGEAINYRHMADCYHCMTTLKTIADISVRTDLNDEQKKAYLSSVHMSDGKTIKISELDSTSFKQSETAATIESMIDRYIFGHTLDISGSYWSRKFKLFPVALTNFLYLSANMKAAAGNVISAVVQLLETGFSGWGSFGAFDALDLITSLPVMVFDGITNIHHFLGDVWNNQSTARMNLILEKFDPTTTSRFQKTDIDFDKRLSKIFKSHPIGMLFSKPDAALRSWACYSALMHKKLYYVDDKGTEQSICLYRALDTDAKTGKLFLNGKGHVLYDKEYTQTKTWSAKYKRYVYTKTMKKVPLDTVFTTKDEDGNLQEYIVHNDINHAVIDKFKRAMRQGIENSMSSINNETKGRYNGHVFMKYLMAMRQWMVNYLQKRWATTKWNADIDNYRVGSHIGTVDYILAPLCIDIMYRCLQGINWVTRGKIGALQDLEYRDFFKKRLDLVDVVTNIKDKGVRNNDTSFLADYQKAALLQTLAEYLVMSGIQMLCNHWLNWDKKLQLPETWYGRLMAYMLVRAKSEGETGNISGGLYSLQSTLKSFNNTSPIIGLAMAIVNWGKACIDAEENPESAYYSTGKHKGTLKKDVLWQKSLGLPKKQLKDFYNMLLEGDDTTFKFYSKDNWYLY